MRRVACMALLLLTLAAAMPATAAPVSRGRLASVQFALASAGGGELRIELTASRSDLGDRLEIGVHRCSDGSCTGYTYYAGVLAANSLSLDVMKARGHLSTHLRGTRLSVNWVPAEGSIVVGGTHGGGQGENLAVALHKDDPASVQVSFGDRHCTTQGFVGDALQVATGDPELTALPLTALRLPRTGLRCSTPEPLV